jgi:hypothetical protein
MKWSNSMSMRLVAKSLLVLTLTSPLAFAKTTVQISCPSLDKIQASAGKIDAAEKYNGMYVAYTSQPAFFEGKHPWLVAAGNLRSNSVSEAIAEGQDKVAKTSSRDTENAIPTDQGVSYCVYAGGNVVGVTMTSAMPAMKSFFK